MRTRASALLGTLLALAPLTARGAPPASVLLLTTPGQRPHLCDAVRIQLAGVAELRCEQSSGLRDLPSGIGELARRVQAQRLTLAAIALDEHATGGAQLVLVGAEPDRALLAFEQGGSAPDVDRALALKLADALDAVLRTRASRAAAADQPASGLGGALAGPTPAALPEPALGKPSPRSALLLETGGAYGAGSAQPLAGVIGIGLRRARSARALELALLGAMGSRTRSEGAAGRLELRGLALHLQARLLWALGRFELGAHALMGVVRIQASGVDATGQRGAGHVLSAQLGVGPDARLELGEHAYLAFAPSLLVAPVAQRFALAGELARELPHLGFSLPLSLGVRTP